MPFKIPSSHLLVRLFDQTSPNEFESTYLTELEDAGYTRQSMLDYLAYWSQEDKRVEMENAVNDADLAQHLNDVLDEAERTVLQA